MTNPAAQNWREIGDTSLRVYRAEFRRVSSPLVKYAKHLYDAARPYSALVLAHMWAENQYSTTGILVLPEHNNPMALRPGPGITVPHTILPGYFLAFEHPADCVLEWKRRVNDPTYKADIYPGGAYTSTTTLDQYLAVYAPSGDVHPVTGEDNADIGYPATIRTMLSRYAAME